MELGFLWRGLTPGCKGRHDVTVKERRREKEEKIMTERGSSKDQLTMHPRTAVFGQFYGPTAELADQQATPTPLI